jgi:hypothetical protein
MHFHAFRILLMAAGFVRACIRVQVRAWVVASVRGEADTGREAETSASDETRARVNDLNETLGPDAEWRV